MLETFAFLNGMYPNEISNDVLHIVCLGEKLKLYSCFSTDKSYYLSKNSNEIFYFDQETHKFYNPDKKEINTIVNFDDYDIITVSYKFS